MKSFLGFASTATVFSLVAMAACGPADRRDGEDGDTDSDIGTDDPIQVDAPPVVDFCATPQPEVCSDGLDNDCDLNSDCGDTDCSGVGDCPVCGEVMVPEANPLVLPDGEPRADYACSSDTQCSTYAGTSCVAKLCRIPYLSTLNFIGFPDGATLDDTSKFLNVCVNMEHSWVRDLQIELITPAGSIIILHDFAGRMGGQVYLGSPNPADNGVAGTGQQYCWTAAGMQTMIEAANAGMPATLPSGDYRPVTPFTAMAGTPLNGEWSLRVTDLWGADDGFLFNWSIAFDPSLVEDCAGPIIGRQFRGRDADVLPINSSSAE